MQIAAHAADPVTTTAPLLVVGVTTEKPFGGAWTKSLDHALKGSLRSAAKDQDFEGKPKQRLVLHTLGSLRCKRVALLGLGDERDLDANTWLTLGANAARLANEVGAAEVVLVFPSGDDLEAKAALAARGAVLGSYDYTEYKSDPGRKPSLRKLAVSADGKAAGGAAAAKKVVLAAKRAVAVAEGVCLCRDLVNRSSLQLYPESFATIATQIGRKAGLKVKVFTPAQLEKMGMNLLLGVGAGSTRAPRLVHLSYEPKSARGKPVVLVGKGITFDSGGLSLKQMPSMAEMKMDMHGAATVLATLQIVAALGSKTPVHGLLALAENMPSGTAIRPSDVLTSAAGKTVEVNNTDAEGRLVLADALHYATQLKPKQIVDIATLTGACMVALGPTTTGLFSNDDPLAAELLGAAARTGEDFWRMPLTPALKAQLKSDVADLKNTGERYGGAITAALFLKEFVADTAWAHLDIAGPAMSTKDSGSLSKGGTGVAVAALADWLTR